MGFLESNQTFRKVRLTGCALGLCFWSSSAWGQAFQAPSGPLGAGLVDSPTQKARLYGEMSVWAEDGADAFPMVFGGGVKVAPPLELQLQIPVAVGHFAPEPPPRSDLRLGGVALGNVQLGANFIASQATWRLKAGAALAYGPWTDKNELDGFVALALSSELRHEELALWLPGTFNITTPLRLEVDVVPHFMISADASFGFHFSVHDSGPEEDIVSLNLAPGMAYTSDVFTAGLRLPLALYLAGNPFNGDDDAQLALEPYARVTLGPAFINTRFTMYLDEPLGFSFDDGGTVWALSFGGGVSF